MTAPVTSARQHVSEVEPLESGTPTRIAIALVRVTVAFLWMSGAAWKVPPDFGEETGSGLYRWVNYAVEYPVFAPYTWLVENLVLPNFTLFGWGVLLAEASLGAFLLVGLFTRLFAVVGIAQSLAITLSVLNTPDEWPWAYYMMIALHVVLLAVAAGRVYGLDGLLRPQWRASTTMKPLVTSLMMRAS